MDSYKPVTDLDGANAAIAQLYQRTDALLGLLGGGAALNADTLGGSPASAFLPASQYTAADVLTKLKGVDGAGSGLDADTVDGQHANAFLTTGASCNKNWNWSGQSGQPPWVWGGSNGTDMYVYNPSNFNVDMVDGLHASAFLGASARAVSANRISFDDGDRANSPTPNGLPRSVRWNFMNGGVLGAAGNTSIGNYIGLITFSPWDGTSGSTGDCSYGLAFGSTAANGGLPRLAIRNGIDAAWNGWYDLWHDGNCLKASGDTPGYLKLQNGVLICWTFWTGTAAVTSAWGSGFGMASAVSLGSFPISFVGTPAVIYGANSGDGAMAALVYSQGAPSASAWGSFNLFRMTSATITNARVSAIAIGRWKY